MESRNFSGIWIPKRLWESKELSSMGKIFLVEIHSLTSDIPCSANNQYFADFFGITKRHVIRVIADLVDRKYLKSEIVYKKGTSSIQGRYLTLTDNFYNKFYNQAARELALVNEQTKAEPNRTPANPTADKKVNTLSLGERKQQFMIEVGKYGNIYPKEMLQGFFEYWTEHNEGGHKMRFEMQKVFDIKKRLNTWRMRSAQFNRKETGSALDILKAKHGL